MKYLSPSLLSCDFLRIGEELELLEEEGLHYLHLDVMDGVYVPNISYGSPIINSIKDKTNLIMDTHLMIENPDKYIEDFVNAGSDVISIHPETTKHFHRSIQLIKSFGIKVGAAINPSTDLSVLEYVFEDLDLVLLMTVNPGFGGQKYIDACDRKISKLNEMRNERNKDLLISVDGGISLENAKKVMNLGADILVSGSKVFNKDDKITRENIRKFKKLGLE